MRTLLIGTLAATLVGCSRLLPPQVSMEACTDAHPFACFNRVAASQPIEPKPASFKTSSWTNQLRPHLAAKTEKPSSAHVRDRGCPACNRAIPPLSSGKVEAPSSNQPAET